MSKKKKTTQKKSKSDKQKSKNKIIDNSEQPVTEDRENKEYINIFNQEPEIVEGNGLQENLKTLAKLNELSIVIGSPDFLSLGNNFVSKFERLKLIKEMSKSQSLISNSSYRGLDNELHEFLSNKFAKKESSPTEGNIRNILKQIADDQKIGIHDAAIMIKPGLTILLLSINNTVTNKHGKTLTITPDELAGKSKLLSKKNIVAAFKRDARLLNTDSSSFSYMINIGRLNNEIICSLYKDGEHCNSKKITEWLKII